MKHYTIISGKQLSEEDVSEFLELVSKILRRYFHKLENPYPVMYGTALLTYAAVPHIIVEKWRKLWEARR